MNRLVISTRIAKLDDILNDVDPNNHKGIYKLNEKCPVLYYDQKTDIFTDIKSDSELILTKDDIDGKSYDLTGINICTKTDCLLHHSQHRQYYSAIVDNSLMGDHDLYGKYYHDIFKIIINNAILPLYKADAIIKTYFFSIMKTSLMNDLEYNQIPENNQIPKYLFEINGLQEQINNLRSGVNYEQIKKNIEQLLFNGQ